MYIHVDILCFFICRNYFFYLNYVCFGKFNWYFCIKNIQEMWCLPRKCICNIMVLWPWRWHLCCYKNFDRQRFSSSVSTICGLLLRPWWIYNQLTFLHGQPNLIQYLPRFIWKAMLFCHDRLQTTAVISFN